MSNLIQLIQEAQREANAQGFDLSVSLTSVLPASNTSPVEDKPAAKKPAAKKPAAKKPEPEEEEVLEGELLDPEEDDDEEDEEEVKAPPKKKKPAAKKKPAQKEKAKITFAEVGTRCRQMCEDYSTQEFKMLLEEFGVGKARDLKESQYAEFMAKLEEEYPSE